MPGPETVDAYAFGVLPQQGLIFFFRFRARHGDAELDGRMLEFLYVLAGYHGRFLSG
jgi:hypothetical protein